MPNHTYVLFFYHVSSHIITKNQIFTKSCGPAHHPSIWVANKHICCAKFCKKFEWGEMVIVENAELKLWSIPQKMKTKQRRHADIAAFKVKIQEIILISLQKPEII